jgi:hypothetical protein
VPEQVSDLGQAGPAVEQSVASECRSRFAPRTGASMPARRNALSTARPAMLPLIGAPTRNQCSTNT